VTPFHILLGTPPDNRWGSRCLEPFRAVSQGVLLSRETSNLVADWLRFWAIKRRGGSTEMRSLTGSVERFHRVAVVWRVLLERCINLQADYAIGIRERSGNFWVAIPEGIQ